METCENQNNQEKQISQSTPELTILMPCLNEEANLGASILAARAFLEENQVVGEILIADNGSTDASVEIALSLNSRVVHVPERGYGNALRCGIQNAYGRYIIMGDCDTTYDFRHLLPFLTLLRSGTDFVIGNRFAGGIAPGAMPFSHRYIGVPFLSWLGRVRCHTDIQDFHCGLRGFRTDLAQSLPLHTGGMEFATEIIACFLAADASIAQIPVTLSVSDSPRKPHLRSIRDGLRHLHFLLWEV